MTSPEPNITEIRSLIQHDLLASNDLAARITQLRHDIAAGKQHPVNGTNIMEISNRDRTKHLVARIASIESQDPMSRTDRELLQALNARLAVCDGLAMRLAELRDLEIEARGERQMAFLGSDPDAGVKVVEPTTDVPAYRPGLSGVSSLVDDLKRLSIAGEEYVQESGASENGEEDADDDEVDTSASWPLLYRILDIDPKTSSDSMKQACDRAMKQLAPKHSPKKLPNDPQAPQRWQAVQRAYDILSDPSKKQFYDAHGRTPAALEDFDVSMLKVS